MINSPFTTNDFKSNIIIYLFGSPGRTRTSDPMINSHLLYQLSYRGITDFTNTYIITQLRGIVKFLFQINKNKLVDLELAKYYDKDFWEEEGWVSCFECDIIFYDLEKLYEHQLIHLIEENPQQLA